MCLKSAEYLLNTKVEIDVMDFSRINLLFICISQLGAGQQAPNNSYIEGFDESGSYLKYLFQSCVYYSRADTNQGADTMRDFTVSS